MFPHGSELPAAIVLMLASGLACFLGYRFFRTVLGLLGFFVGAFLFSSMTDVTDAVGMIMAGLIGGVIGALVLIFAYFVGIALVGAGLGVLLMHLTWSQASQSDPPALAIIGIAIVGAAVGMFLQKYVIIVGTAFAGAWLLILGAMTALGTGSAVRAVGASDAWILYPLSPWTERWTPFAWIALGLLGTGFQLGVTARKGR